MHEFRVYSIAISKEKQRNIASTRFVIFAQGRTGSTLLTDLLNSHHEISCNGEILFDRKLFPRTFINGMCAISKSSVYGFKLKIYQIRETQKIRNTSQFMVALANSGWKIIYLKRRNIFRHALSDIFLDYRKAAGLGAHHTKLDGALSLVKRNVDCDKLMHFIRVRDSLLEEEKAVLKDVAHMTITYEDALLNASDQQSALNRIFDYLGLEHLPAHTKYMRTSSYNLADFVRNYDEVIRTLNGTNYEKYLFDT